MVIVFSLLISIIGLAVWFMNVPSPKPWAEFGRTLFWVGLLAFLLTGVGPGLALLQHTR